MPFAIGILCPARTRFKCVFLGNFQLLGIVVQLFIDRLSSLRSSVFGFVNNRDGLVRIVFGFFYSIDDFLGILILIQINIFHDILFRNVGVFIDEDVIPIISKHAYGESNSQCHHDCDHEAQHTILFHCDLLMFYLHSIFCPTSFRNTAHSKTLIQEYHGNR